jgi:sugar phosphate isomerase/epimerase
MTFSYHNHDVEFRPLEGADACMMDLLLDEADPALLHFIPDVGWIHYAGQDSAAVLRKMAGRVKVIHFKDYVIDKDGNRRFVSLGKGVVNLRECYETACELGIPYIAYEQDDGWVNGDAFEATQESWAFMQSLII